MSRPAPEIQNFMEGVKARLEESGGLEQPSGTAYLTDLGAIVHFQTVDETMAAAVFTEQEQFVGSITIDGQIIYA